MLCCRLCPPAQLYYSRPARERAKVSAGMNNPAQYPVDATGARLKYWAFLSYSHRDAKWANWLHRKVESYRPPKVLVGTVGQHGPIPKRLSPMFRDREELATATDLGTVIGEALRQSACQIVICSRQSAKSKWVNEEILAFKRLGREDRIFCLIIDGEPNASDNPATADEECFPPALRYKLDAEGNLSSHAHRADRGRRPPRQGRPQQRQAQAHRRRARRGLRCAAPARGAAAHAPAGRHRQRHDRRHDRDHRPCGLRAGAARRGPAPEGARRGRGGDRQADHEIPGRPVPHFRSERGARQHGHRARDARQGRGAHR